MSSFSLSRRLLYVCSERRIFVQKWRKFGLGLVVTASYQLLVLTMSLIFCVLTSISADKPIADTLISHSWTSLPGHLPAPENYHRGHLNPG